MPDLPTNGSAPWPPPPDLDSIKELFANADVEGFIAAGGPVDEYETEAEELHMAIETWQTSELTAARLLPILTDIWEGAFSLSDDETAKRVPKLQALAAEIERFFGPEARPQVRGS